MLHDSVGLKGYLKVFRKFQSASGTLGRELHFEGDNLIVNSGKAIFLLSLYTSSVDQSLKYAKVGTGGATDAGGIYLKTPTPSMTDLYNPVAVIPMTKSHQNLAVPSITLTASLDNADGNGLSINEAGFFAGTDAMFNIKTFPKIDKTYDFSIDLEWTISVV